MGAKTKNSSKSRSRSKTKSKPKSQGKKEASKSRKEASKSRKEASKSRKEASKSKKESISKPEKVTEPKKDNSKHELRLKDHVSDQVYECLARNYNVGREGYITVIGGEAINYYLSKEKKIKTGDFDLKFVVNPQYTSREEDLKRVNMRRLKVVTNLMKCLAGIKAPAGYDVVYPKLAIKIRDKARLVYTEGGKLYWVDPFTGEEKFVYYSPNKVFTIMLYYRIKGEKELNGFGLIDLSLFYRRPHGYSYFGRKIYDAFLNEPFRKKVPIPFVVKNNVRYPILPFMLFDNFRMTLIALDNLTILKSDPEKVTFWNNKLKKYWNKINIMLDALEASAQSKDLKELEAAMHKTYADYQPLAFLNMLCYREGIIYTDTLQKKKECDEKYQKQLKEFEAGYLDVATKTSKLRY
jgi:hypothetical protein